MSFFDLENLIKFHAFIKIGTTEENLFSKKGFQVLKKITSKGKTI